MHRETVLYLTHKINKCVIREFEELKKTAGDRQVFLLYNGHWFKEIPTPNFCFSDDELWSLGYPTMGNKLIPGHSHFPLFLYFKEHIKSAFYWIIEYDVRFTGKWHYLFDDFENSQSDLITSLIEKYHERPNWPWWEISHPDKYIKNENRIRSFNPIYRISKPAIEFLNNAFLSGWKGHYETTFTTLLHHHGNKLQDFGGVGEFVKGKRKKFYTNYDFMQELYTFGTHRFRPVRNKAGCQKNKLYHPVKPQSNAGFLRNLRFFKQKLHARYGITTTEMIRNILFNK